MFRCRINVSTLIFLVVLQGATVVLLSSWYLQLSPCHSDPSGGRVHVLLLSSWRSGSSFIGQVFSQHPSVFYYMEPGWHLWKKLSQVNIRYLRHIIRDFFRNIFLCDLSAFEPYLEKPLMNHIFVWSRSRAMCSPPACPLTPRGNLSNSYECEQKCKNRSLEVAKTACDTYTHVVIKEVRIFDLESLYPLLQDPLLNLHIVHLVRDPRAVLRSREQSQGALSDDNSIILSRRYSSASTDMLYEVMQEICHSHVRINEKASLKAPSFLKNRYKMVRYEDLVRDPLGGINSIFKFVGLDMPEHVAQWIYMLTHGKGTGSKSEAFKITARDAEDVSQYWRTALSYDKVKRVQDVCKGAMSLIGYRTVNSETEQKNLNIDLLVPNEPYKFAWLQNKTG